MNADIPDDSWRVLQAMRPNVLVIDPDADHRDLVVHAVLEGSRTPLWRCAASRLDLPPEHVGTLVLDGVDDLDVDAQRALLAWMELNRGTQVIAVAPRPVYPGVAAGTFLDGLYYRLNVLVVDGSRLPAQSA